MADETAFERKLQTHKRLGPGGMKCTCCGPSPKERPAFRRAGRTRSRTYWKRDIQRQIREAGDEQE